MDDRAHQHFTVLERKELSARQVHAALRRGTTLGLSLMAQGSAHHARIWVIALVGKRLFRSK
jgi:hypothetical protein